jgi:transcriptional regulator with XRE-family HTH domain
MDKEREIQIGVRLREFREALQIPRTKFAVTIRFGGERIASYESGRVPLPYDVARAVMHHYQINPAWLATGQGDKRLVASFDDGSFAHLIKPRTLFSAVFDAHRLTIEQQVAELPDKASDASHQMLNDLLRLHQGEVTESLRKKTEKKLDPLLRIYLKDPNKKAWNLPLSTSADQESLLTKVSIFGNNMGVKAKLPALIKRLNEATKERGAKTQLAKFIGVPLPKISQWLSGEHEPGGETTLKLLYWVEQRDRQK